MPKLRNLHAGVEKFENIPSSLIGESCFKIKIKKLGAQDFIGSFKHFTAQRVQFLRSRAQAQADWGFFSTALPAAMS